MWSERQIHIADNANWMSIFSLHFFFFFVLFMNHIKNNEPVAILFFSVINLKRRTKAFFVNVFRIV